MMQQQSHRQPHKHPSQGGKHADLNVAALKKRADEAAKRALENLEDAQAQSEALRLKEEAEEAAAHELKHIEEAKAQKAPKRMCLRRATFTPQDKSQMHGGCGGL
jgi:hypothetical protein